MRVRQILAPGLLVLVAGAGLGLALVGLGPVRREPERAGHGPADFVLIPSFPASILPGRELDGHVTARDRQGAPIAGMRVRWEALARGGGPRGGVRIAQGTGLTDATGRMSVRFRAKAIGRQGLPWVERFALTVRGADDLGRPITATAAIPAARAGESSRPPASGSAGVELELRAPAFLRLGDRAILTGLVRNVSEAPLEFRAMLDLVGLEPGGATRRPLRLGADQQARLSWPVLAARTGPAQVAMAASGPHVGAAVQATLSVQAVGRLLGQAWSGHLDKPGPMELAVSRAALPDTVQFRAVLTASPGAAGLAAALALALRPAQGDPSVPALPPGDAGSDAAAARLLAAVEAVSVWPGARPLRETIARDIGLLAGAQNPDGGWGWHAGMPSRFDLSAFAMRALAQASDGGFEAPANTLRLAERHLRGRAGPISRFPDVLANVVWALGARADDALRAAAWQASKRLGPADLARLTEGLALAGDPRALQALAQLDLLAEDEAEYAHWEGVPADSLGRSWDSGTVETTAGALRARLRIFPPDDLAHRVASWLVRARRGEGWGAPRMSAIAAAALSAYGRHAPPGAPVAVAALLDGAHLATLRVPAALPHRLLLDGSRLGPGRHSLLLAPADGPDSLGTATAFAASLTYLESGRSAEPQADTPLEIRRDWFGVPVARLGRAGGISLGAVATAAGVRNLAPLRNEVQLDRAIVTRLRIVARQALQFVRVVDPLPAGAAPVRIAQSAAHRLSTNGQAVTMDLPELAPGTHDYFHVWYTRHAGDFAVPGPVAAAVHAPDIRARGTTSRLNIAP